MVDWIFPICYNRNIVSKKEHKMGYKVVDTTDQMRGRYQSRAGLEGPFNFSWQVLYYDNKEGAYYDPTTDFYVSQEEMDIINQRFYQVLKK